VPTGHVSGLDVLDLDIPRHPEARTWLVEHMAALSPTRQHATRSGGLHVLFRHADGVRNSAGRLAPGVDVRGEGGYAIWWPASGCAVLCDAPPSPWPQWLLGVVLRAPSTPPSGNINLAGFEDRRLAGLVRTVALAREGGRNNSLYWCACRLAEAVAAGRIDREFGTAVLALAATRAGLPEKESRFTIASAFKRAGQ
jgi:hypothetical protein